MQPIAHAAVVMPAFNEAEGIAGFLGEIVEHVGPLCETLTLVVVDDRSTDGMPGVLDDLAARTPALRVVHAERNRGHGPTALRAYREGLASRAEVVVHVDGDGQFLGGDIARVAAALVATRADVVHGVRRHRTDPWFRRVLTGISSVVVAITVGHRVPDVNTPLRAYRPAPLAALVAAVPEDALIPHVHFSLAEVRRGLRVRYAAVRSIPRRGAESTGTMWGAVRAPKLPPPRLRAFVRAAAAELWRISLSPRRAR